MTDIYDIMHLGKLKELYSTEVKLNTNLKKKKKTFRRFGESQEAMQTVKR